MTIADNYVPLKQLGNGVTTQFSGAWPMLNAAYAQVFLQDSVTGVQTPVTQGPAANQYQISLTSTSFTVTFGTAPLTTQYAVIGRSTARSQTTPYTTSGGFQGANEEFSYDKLTAMQQEAVNTFSRAIVAPLADTANLTLPTATARANQFLGFDASGNVSTAAGVTGVAISSAMVPVVQATTLALARTAMGVAGLADNNTFTGSNTFSNVNTTSINSGPIAGSRNRVINGDMRIDQRQEGASITTPTDGQYIVDRFLVSVSVTGKFSIGQNVNAPAALAGFPNWLGATSLSAYTVATTDLFAIQHRIEGYNVSDLSWGTANAKAATLSFWAYSSLTGNFGGAVQNSAQNRSYPYTYNIPVANTWTYITVAIPGDTAGTWNAVNGIGASIYWDLGAGSTRQGPAGAWAASNFQAPTGGVSVVGTNGATLNITGVQFEQGTIATPYERRSWAAELANCERYFTKSFPPGTAPVQNANNQGAWFWQQICGASTGSFCTSGIRWPVQMRVTPTVVFFNPAAANAQIRCTGTGTDYTLTTNNVTDQKGCLISGTTPAGSTITQIAEVHTTASAEL